MSFSVTTDSGTSHPYIGTNGISFTNLPTGLTASDFTGLAGTSSSCEESNGAAVDFTVDVAVPASVAVGTDAFTIDVTGYFVGYERNVRGHDRHWFRIREPYCCEGPDDLVHFDQPLAGHGRRRHLHRSRHRQPGLTPVVFSIDASSTTGACTSTGTNGQTITFTGIGTCIVDANQAGNSTYAAATQAQQTITVNGKSQTITFTSTNPSPVTVGGATYTAAATASSGLTPVVFSIDASSTTGACTSTGTNGQTITFTGIGTCIVDANQAGNSTYAAATEVQQTITVNGKSQTITFTSTNPSPVTVGGATYTAAATASSGLTPVVFSLSVEHHGCLHLNGHERPDDHLYRHRHLHC